MLDKRILILTIAAVVSLVGCSRDRNTKPNKVVCYYASWSTYRSGDGKFVVEDIDPLLCTHLIYAFAILENNQITPQDKWADLRDDGGLGGYERFNNLRSKNGELTTMIAIGGGSEDSGKYSRMAADSGTRKTFVDSCLQFLQKYNFDGLDLDWEFPGTRGGKPEDKQNFVTLIKELKAAFAPYGYVLSAAVSADKGTIDIAYNVPELSNNLDFVNLMAYDFHGAWASVTGHNAPMNSKANEGQYAQNLNVRFAVNYWLNQGMSSRKMTLGMPFYGRSFTLQDPNNRGIGAPAKGAGTAGPYTQEAGVLNYNEICLKVKEESNWQITTDPEVQAPYMTKGDQWVGYDNYQSILTKTNFSLEKQLGGGMVWAIDGDDFRGKCLSAHKYPLLNAIKRTLNG